MGLSVKMSAEEEQESILVTECTGDYSSENKTGFGGPNYKKTDIYRSILKVQTPKDTTEYPHEINVTNALPNSAGTPLQITPTMLGMTEIESGQYKFMLIHTFSKKHGGYTDKTGYETEVFVKNIKCCIDGLGIDPGKNAFKDEKQKKILELQNLLIGVDSQIEAGLFDTANTTIDYLKSQCKCNGCK